MRAERPGCSHAPGTLGRPNKSATLCFQIFPPTDDRFKLTMNTLSDDFPRGPGAEPGVTRFPLRNRVSRPRPFLRTAPAAFAAVLMLTGVCRAGSVTTLDDIEFWVGGGSNRAGLVIDWADGRDPLAWGYRWDGDATGEDMLRAVDERSERLGVELRSFSFGESVEAIGYDRDGDGFAESDPQDSFARAGDFVSDFRFWNYYVAADSPYSPADGDGAWTSSDVGISDRGLTDGAFDGFRFQTFGASVPGRPSAAPAPVPEPATALLVLLAAGAAVRRRGRVLGKENSAL